MNHFKGKQFQQDVIIVAVGYYLRYNLSYREVQELLYDRGINICHTTIYRWVQEAYTEENPRLTYLHLGIQAALLLNSGAADFVITGCGTGQGALMSLNMYPGVVCGYCIEPTDAYLFLQINNGNALSLPYAKGFGWGAELNLNNIFSRAFGSPKGMGYPDGRKEAQNKNAKLLFDVKKQVAKPLLEALHTVDAQLVKECMIPRFLDCFYAGCKDAELKKFVDGIVKAK